MRYFLLALIQSPRLSVLLTFTILWSPLAVNAADQGFRFNGQACVNASGQQGLNPAFFGQCGDLRHATVSGLTFDGTDFSGAMFDNSDLENCSLNGTNLSGASFVATKLAGVSMTGATLHGTNFTQALMRGSHLAGSDIQNANFSKADLEGELFSTMSLAGSRFKGADLTGAKLDGADLTGVDLSGSVLSQANLQNATLDNAVLNGAILRASDLTKASLKAVSGLGAVLDGSVMRQCNLEGATLSQASFRGAKLDNAALDKAKLVGADFRSADLSNVTYKGADFTGAQVNRSSTLPFSKDDAAKMGMIVGGANLLLIYDDNDGYAFNLIANLQNMGLQVTVSEESTINFKGDLDLGNYSAILHLNGQEYSQDLPLGGQQALVAFVQGGGTYINTGADIFSYSQYNLYQSSKDLILLQYQAGMASPLSLSPATGQSASHPLFIGMTFPVATSANTASVSGTPMSFASNPVVTLLTDANNDPIVTSRDLGTGHVVSIALCTGYNMTCLADPTFQRLVFNAANW